MKKLLSALLLAAALTSGASGQTVGPPPSPSGGVACTGSFCTASAPLSGALGGTGVANTSKTITLGGNLTTSGAFTTTLTVTGNTNVTLPTSGTLSSVTPPCSAFGTSAGTCTEGNDARLGAGAVTGAIKSNGSNTFGQAASTDLSDVVGSTSFTPNDASGSALSLSSVSAHYVKVGKLTFVTISVDYPSPGDANAAKLGNLPCSSISSADGNTQLAAATGASLALGGVVLQNTNTVAAINTATGAAPVTNAQLAGQTVRYSGSYICQ